MTKAYQHQLFRSPRLFLKEGEVAREGLSQWTIYYASQVTEHEGSSLRRVVGSKHDVTEPFMALLQALVTEVLSDCPSYDAPNGQDFFSVQDVLDAFGIERQGEGEPLIVMQQDGPDGPLGEMN